MYLTVVILLAVALLVASITWQRTLSAQQQELRYLSGVLTQGFRSYFSTQDTVLRALGEELIYRGTLESAQRGESYLRRAQGSHSAMLGYALFDTSGEFVVGSVDQLVTEVPSMLADPVTAEEFIRVLETGRFQVGRPRYFEPLQEWLIPLRAPIFDANDEIVAVMSAGLRLDAPDAPWSRMQVDEGLEIALVRNDQYLGYLYPLPLTIERRDRVFSTPVSNPLMAIVRSQPGLTVYDRPYQVAGGTLPYYLWVESIPEYGMSAVAMRDKRKVVQAWLSSLLLPFLVWLVALGALYYGYVRARNLLAVADADLRELNEELNHSVLQYDQLTQMLPVGVYQGQVDANHKQTLLYVNQRAREITGISPEVPLNKVFALAEEKIHPADRYEYQHVSSQAVAANEPFEWRGRLLNGSEVRWLELRAVPDSQHEGRWNGVLIDITTSKKAEAEINQLAFYDSLTQLPNRRLVRERIQQLLARLAKQPEHCALIVIDIDRFKIINESLGQTGGDLILKQIAERLQQGIRENDVVGRLSSDEFVVVQTRLAAEPQVAASQTRALTGELARVFDCPFTVEGAQQKITASMGITLFNGQSRHLFASNGLASNGPSNDIDILVQQAEQAVQQAKAAGRNTQLFYDESIQSLLSERMELLRSLPVAIQQSQFELHYQCVVNAKSEVAGVEALVRWNHPERGRVNPADFIAIAEESGDIIALGEWILKAACEQLVRWHSEPQTAHLMVAVNISVRQLRAHDFVQRVLDILQQTGASAAHLVLEITESMLMDETENAIEKMQALRAHGVQFALDDFGTGYSSLSYLNRLPLDKLKIDQSFVQSLHTNESRRTLTRTIISLGESLNMELVAEGVETAEQLQLLAEQGCHYFQGYWINRPLPADQLSTMFFSQDNANRLR
ncbi:bifunctional diguanylate cyclase/phosphodiesterase [Aliidiomarina celeris]|uniref:bifunctional diguanylate cyclase/phosphodiesterase n=1 Tax=Aliidiomarina celeris TaxID=2249428 RepID=UPI000DE81487|nr:EAL domain-containing protein [Aliidiomarina celeris]